MFKLGDTTQSSIIRMNFTKNPGVTSHNDPKGESPPERIITIFRYIKA